MKSDWLHTCLGCSFTSNLGEGILLEAGIEDGIGDLITKVAIRGMSEEKIL